MDDDTPEAREMRAIFAHKRVRVAVDYLQATARTCSADLQPTFWRSFAIALVARIEHSEIWDQAGGMLEMAVTDALEAVVGLMPADS